MQATSGVFGLFKANLESTRFGKKEVETLPRCNAQDLGEFIVFHQQRLSQRSVENWCMLTEMGNALRYYSIVACVTSLDVLSNILRTASGQWYYAPSQWITIFAFTVDTINNYASAYRERGVLQNHGKGVRTEEEELLEMENDFTRGLPEWEASTNTDLLTDEQRREVRRLIEKAEERYHGIRLGDMVGHTLVDESLLRRGVSGAVTFGSFAYVLSAIGALIVEGGGEALVPLNNTSSWLSITSHSCILLSCLASMPFFASVAKDTYEKIRPSIDVKRFCDQKLQEVQVRTDDTFIVYQGALRLVKLHQRTYELIVRCFSLSMIGVCLFVLGVWEILEFLALKDDPLAEEESIARNLANGLNMPMLVCFSVGSGAYLLNFIIKGFWDGYRCFLKIRARKAFEEAQVESALYKQRLGEYLATYKHLLLWSVAYTMKKEVAESSQFTDLLRLSGLNEDVVQGIRKSGASAQELEDAAFLMANSRLGLIDTV